MLGAKLSDEGGRRFFDWIFYLEGLGEEESLFSGETVEGRLYDVGSQELIPEEEEVEVVIDERPEPKILENGENSYSFLIPENMVPSYDNDREVTSMRISDSDFPSTNKLTGIRTENIKVPEVSTREQHSALLEQIYQQELVPYDIPRRETYIDLVRYRSITPELKESILENQ